MEWSKRQLKRLTNLSDYASASEKELRDAQLEADLSQLRYALARFEHEQAIRNYERERLRLVEHKLCSPFRGYIAELLRRVGETVEEREGIVVLAQLDPLDVVIDCPLGLASMVRVGQEVKVQPVDRQWRPRTGRVILAGPVADAASQTFRVKIRVANEDTGWLSGLKVLVNFGAAQETAESEPPAPKVLPIARASKIATTQPSVQ